MFILILVINNDSKIDTDTEVFCQNLNDAYLTLICQYRNSTTFCFLSERLDFDSNSFEFLKTFNVDCCICCKFETFELTYENIKFHCSSYRVVLTVVCSI